MAVVKVEGAQVEIELVGGARRLRPDDGRGLSYECRRVPPTICCRPDEVASSVVEAPPVIGAVHELRRLGNIHDVLVTLQRGLVVSNLASGDRRHGGFEWSGLCWHSAPSGLGDPDVTAQPTGWHRC